MNNFAIKFGFIFFQFVVVSNLFANSQVSYKPNIKSVTVYHLGAEITHEINMELETGLTTVIIENVSPKILTRHVQLNDRDITLINATLQRKYTIDEIKQLEEQKKTYLNQIAALDKKLNQLENVNTSLELAGIFSFYESSYLSIKTKLSQVETKLAEANENNSKIGDDKTNLKLLVSTTKNVKKEIELKYLVGATGWAVSYEIFAESSKETIELTYIAKIMNRTGEDWNNVKISVSSAFPLDEPTEIPVIEPWYIENRYNYVNKNDEFKETTKQINQQIDKLEGVEYVEIEIPAKFSKTEIPKNQTVPSNGAVYSLFVFKKNLLVNYLYHAIPSIDNNPYLVAKVTNWDSLPLISGIAKINYDGLNVGTSKIEINSESDTLNITLGKDNNVMISKVEIGNIAIKKESGSKIKETFAYTINLKNQTKTTKQIKVIDQIPVSQINSVEVEIQDISTGTLDKETGILEWNFKLAPGEFSNQTKLIYSVEYQKGGRKMITSNYSKKKFRTISAPSF